MQFPNGSASAINMMYPLDNHDFWSKLKAFINYEPVSAIDPELRGVLASIGIIKGQPFNPDAKQQEALRKAVETPLKMVLALRQLGRPDGRNLYYKDRQYENVWASPRPIGSRTAISMSTSGPPTSRLLTRRLPQWSCAHWEPGPNIPLRCGMRRASS